MSRSSNKIPPLSPLQRRFVATFPAVTAELGQAAPGGETSPDGSELWGLAHQLMLSGDHFGLPEITRAARGLEKALRARSNRPAADAAIPCADLNAPIAAVIEQLGCLSATATSGDAVQPVEPGMPAAQDPRLIYALTDDDAALGHLTRHLEAHQCCLVCYSGLALLQIGIATKTPAALLIHHSHRDSGRSLAELRSFVGPRAPIAYLGGAGPGANQLAVRRAGASTCLPEDVSGAALLAWLSTHAGLGLADPGRVLLACDCPRRARTIARAVASVALSVCSESGLERVLDQVTTGRHHLLLMDMRAAGSAQLDVGAMVRQTPTGALMPIVYLGSEPSPDRRAYSAGMGPDDHLPADVDPGALAHLVRARVDGARQLAGAIAVDPVTGLANRSAFEQQFEQLVGVMVRNRAVLSVVMVEVDGFRRFRDRHGVQAGDRLMRDLADEIRRRFRYSDLVSRYGQARFVLALPDSGLFATLMSIEKLKRQLAGPNRDSASRAHPGSAHIGANCGATAPDSGTGAPCITLSGGVSTCRFSAGGRETPLRAGQLIESAGHALQIALEAGGNCVRTGDRRAA